MAIDLAVMRKRLEEKQAELQQHIASLRGSPAQPEDAIQASDGVVEPEEVDNPTQRSKLRVIVCRVTGPSHPLSSSRCAICGAPAQSRFISLLQENHGE